MQEIIIKKIQNIVAGWKQKMLLKAGRMVLLNSVLCRLLSLFKMFVSISKGTNQIQMNFPSGKYRGM